MYLCWVSFVGYYLLLLICFMPRKIQTLTIEQIEEFLAHNPTLETLTAVKSFLQAELDRRTKAGETGGRPKEFEGSPKERNRQAAAKHRAKKRAE